MKRERMAIISMNKLIRFSHLHNNFFRCKLIHIGKAYRVLHSKCLLAQGQQEMFVCFPGGVAIVRKNILPVT